MDDEEPTYQEAETQTILKNIYLRLTFEPVWKREKFHKGVQTDIPLNKWDKYEMSWTKYNSLKKRTVLSE